MLTNRPRSFQDTLLIETVLSDFHKMTASVLKTFAKKEPPKMISFCEYKYFSNDLFQAELNLLISSHDINSIPYDHFDEIFMPLVNKYIPLKFKYVRANQVPFTNRPLRKAIMLRSKLKNCYLKDKNPDSLHKYKIQCNICTNLLRKAKREYFSNLKCSVVKDNKNFWKSIKPIFSDKYICSERITLIDDNNIVTDDISLATTFNDFFSNTVKNLLEWWQQNLLEWWQQNLLEWWQQNILEWWQQNILEWWQQNILEWWQQNILEW